MFVQVVKTVYCEFHGVTSPRFPVGFVHLQLPAASVDVNVEPNKTKVFVENEARLKVRLHFYSLELCLCFLQEKLSKVFEEIIQEIYNRESTEVNGDSVAEQTAVGCDAALMPLDDIDFSIPMEEELALPVAVHRSS